MKACESVQNYPSRVREMSNYTVREVKRVCTQIGERESGSENETKAQQYAAQSMQNICDSIETEEFSVSPRAFASSVKISALSLLVSFVGFVLCSLSVFGKASVYVGIVSLVFSLISIAVLAGEFILSKKLIDALFPKKTASNVIFTRKASGETKRRIVFAGNMDSSYEWRYSYKSKGKSTTALIYVLLAAAVINFILDIAAVFDVFNCRYMENLIAVFVFFAATAIPAFMSLAFVNFKSVSQGANANLTGAFAGMAVLRFMDANKIRFENTEVVALSTSCKECGMRGAQAFAEKHKNDGVETVIIAVDTLHEFEKMGVCVDDKHTGTSLDKDVAELLKTAGKTAGYELKEESALMTDATAFCRGGMKSATLTAANSEKAGLYHTRLDTADTLSLKAVEAGISVMLETAFLFDEQGL